MWSPQTWNLSLQHPILPLSLTTKKKLGFPNIVSEPTELDSSHQFCIFILQMLYSIYHKIYHRLIRKKLCIVGHILSLEKNTNSTQKAVLILS